MLVRVTMFAAVLALLSQAAIADVHTLTYSKKARIAGKVEDINGDQFVVVRLPVRDFAQSTKYDVAYLAPSLEGIVFTFLATQHTDETFTPNITIDGFPALVAVRDGRDYNLESDYTGSTGNPANYLFSVEHAAYLSVQIKVGGMMLLFQQSFIKQKQPAGGGDINIGPVPNALGWADWGAYHDPTGLVDAADQWIDFITIAPIP